MSSNPNQPKIIPLYVNVTVVGMFTALTKEAKTFAVSASFEILQVSTGTSVTYET